MRRNYVKIACEIRVVSALSGVAVVSIHRETPANAFVFKREVRNELEEFKNAYLVVVDEGSFASVEDVQLLNEKMKEIFDRPTEPFGGAPIVLTGDFTQLSPMKVNHRFDKDSGWRELLKRFRDSGLTTDEVAIINSRVIGSPNGPLEKNIPSDAVYATKTNVDRMAINDAIFVKHLEKTHTTDASIQLNAYAVH